ncbi:GP5 [Branchiostoma lanceolatum]|uniref:GP5 protein n=1 Tax=Branchiostoma lanceolatum TaxID=7740 RepID=A0A8J9ZDI5_BRALA|nr:GP5 [Branchiostoma lanceolatum]
MASMKAVSLLLLVVAVFSWASLVQTSCPKGCECLEGTKIVNCSRLGLPSVPSGIPTDVQQLILEHNNIATLSRNDFVNLSSVESIDLSDNKLNSQSISPGTFDGLPSLGTLDLSYNKNLDDFPAYLPSRLTYLYFISNSAVHVSADAFANLTEIVHLDFSDNKVETIAPGAFKNQQKLQVLYCDFNKLKDEGIPPSVYKPATKLQNLGLRFNQLTRAPVDLPVGLQALDLVGNQIKELPPKAFRNLTELQSLAFWEQPTLTTIDDDAFYGLSKLQGIDASSTGINKLTNGTFNGLSGMGELVLGECKIPDVPVGAFHQMTSLTTLWLDGNLLKTLDPGVLDRRFLSHLSEVYLWGNPWTCDCHLRWLKEHIDNNNTAPTIDAPHVMTCNAPPKLKGRAWDTLTAKDFVCG